MASESPSSATRPKLKLGISACLLGKRVRYDGDARLDAFLANTWGRHIDFIELCPETGAGLKTPREPMRLLYKDGEIAVVGIQSGEDNTERIARWCEKKLSELENAGIDGFILKSKSPSCAGDALENGDTAQGVLASRLSADQPLIPIADEKSVQDPVLRDLFVTRLFTLARWRETKKSAPTSAGLIAFHTANKLLFLTHSPAHYRTLGRIVANPRREPLEGRFRAYEAELLALLTHPSSTGRHVNALEHIAGYFRGKIDEADRAELNETIEKYRHGLVSIAVPIALVNHHNRKTPHPFLTSQTYLHPHPLEIGLRG